MDSVRLKIKSFLGVLNVSGGLGAENEQIPLHPLPSSNGLAKQSALINEKQIEGDHLA